MTSTENIPEKKLEDLDLDEKKRQRYAALKERFKSKYGEEPLFYARAPGRVNLIGEHIDYCGYSVLPMAIEHDILMAVSLNDDSEIRLANFEPRFEDFKTSTNDIQINKDKPEWFNYFLCGYKGIMEKFGKENGGKGINVCVYGTIPKSAGLSSSSAMVVCSSLVTLHANKLSLTKTELAETCAVSERYVGTQGGGMDQAISTLAEAGSAKLIDFNPLKVTNVRLPNGALFVITNCCVESNKAASNYFNTRVVECRLATQVLAKSHGLDWKKFKKPIELQKELNASFKDLIDTIKTKMHPNEYTMDELASLLGTTQDEIISVSLTPNTANLRSFQLYNRIMHVFGEAQRVHEFKDACSLSDSEEALKRLGELMNDSHASCRDLYECSCPELDELTQICRESGARGSRLTGAGWGGCAVSLIPQDKLDHFLSSIEQRYYSKSELLKAQFPLAAFSTKPSDGIAIYLP